MASHHELTESLTVHKSNGIQVPPGECLEFPFTVRHASSLYFKVAVENNYDIGVGVYTFPENAVVGTEESDLIAVHRCVEEENVVQIQPNQTCVVVFDNTHSWVRAKTVSYEILIMKAALTGTLQEQIQIFGSEKARHHKVVVSLKRLKTIEDELKNLRSDVQTKEEEEARINQRIETISEAKRTIQEKIKSGTLTISELSEAQDLKRSEIISLQNENTQLEQKKIEEENLRKNSDLFQREIENECSKLQQFTFQDKSFQIDSLKDVNATSVQSIIDHCFGLVLNQWHFAEQNSKTMNLNDKEYFTNFVEKEIVVVKLPQEEENDIESDGGEESEGEEEGEEGEGEEEEKEQQNQQKHHESVGEQFNNEVHNNNTDEGKYVTITEKHVEMVMLQTGVNADVARKMLRKHNDNYINAILELSAE
eukprot:c13063_g1_i1.p1 GENE.c13063_g1_i1~~c13063_g1_i1.p1  ORF type:complete len:430 (+),score=234.84 c13063_g1_i1:24-1292(+)